MIRETRGRLCHALAGMTDSGAFEKDNGGVMYVLVFLSPTVSVDGYMKPAIKFDRATVESFEVAITAVVTRDMILGFEGGLRPISGELAMIL
jgi:hypothetical protein